MRKQVLNRRPTAEYVKSRLDYDPSTGSFTWKEKPPELDSRGWNSRLAGSEAGYVARVSPDHWAERNYHRINLDGVSHYAHRLAWLFVHGEWPAEDIDHINGDSLDNRIENLRPANPVQNKSNTRRRFNSRSPYKCVAWRSDCPNRPWRALVSHAGQTLISEHFTTAEEAGRAVDRVTREHFGEYAFQNFPEGPLR